MGAPHVPLNGVAAEFLSADPTFHFLYKVLLLSVSHELSEVREGDSAYLANPGFLGVLSFAVLVIFRHVGKHSEALVAVPRATNRSLLVCGSVTFHLVFWYFFKTISTIYQSFILEILQISLIVDVETYVFFRLGKYASIRFLAESTPRIFGRTIVRLRVEVAAVIAEEGSVYITRMFFQFVQGIKACTAYLALKIGN